MSDDDVIRVWVDGIGVLGPGISNWSEANAVLRGEVNHEDAPTVLPAPEVLPPAERRRASRIVKAGLAVGLEACRQAGVEPASLANVFAASGGDGHNCHALCELLATDERQISPTRFHNSVHNAASGYWSIATGATPAGQVLGAYDASFAAGLLEAMNQVEFSQMPVLLVACDSEYPDPLHAKRPIRDTGALALVLTPARTDHSLGTLAIARRGALRDVPRSELVGVDQSLSSCVGSMPSMRGLPLVQALISGAPAQPIAVEYFSPQSLIVQVTAADPS